MFTKNQIQEIASLLKAASIKDSKFTIVSALEGTEYLPILQDAKNRKILLSEVYAYLAVRTSPTYAAVLDIVRETLHSDILVSTTALQNQIAESKKDIENTILDSRDEVVAEINDVKHRVKTAEDHLAAEVASVQSYFDDNLADAISGIVDASVLNGLSSVSAQLCSDVADVVDDRLEEYFTSTGIITTREINDIMTEEEE